MPRIVILLLAVALAGCAGAPRTGANLAATHAFPGLTCAPFARALTGLALGGDAADWWAQAGDRYPRGPLPQVGGVLVFRRTARLPAGHVAVVSAVLDARHIHVIQANWMPGELDIDQLVVDVSERNDWTAVRVWYPPGDQLGAHAYPAYGFILAPSPRGHAALTQAAVPVARFVTGG
jgi:surface antigen